MAEKRKPAAEEEPAVDRARADVGIVAALRLELDPLLDKMDRVKTYSGGDFTYRGGFLKDIRIATVEAGAGSKRAERAAQALIDAHRPEWMFSIGFAGGLTDELQIGDVVVANRLIAATDRKEDEEAGLKLNFKLQPDPKKGLHVGTLATAAHIVRTVDEKRELHARTGAIAVDMESLAVAEACRDRKVKFLAVRGITDDNRADLPAEVLSVLGGTGTIRTGAVVGALWKRPSSYKDLWRLRQNAQLAGERLALYLVSMIKQMVEPKSW